MAKKTLSEAEIKKVQKDLAEKLKQLKEDDRALKKVQVAAPGVLDKLAGKLEEV